MTALASPAFSVRQRLVVGFSARLAAAVEQQTAVARDIASTMQAAADRFAR